MKAVLMLPTVIAASWLPGLLCFSLSGCENTKPLSPVAGDPDPEEVLNDAAQSMQDIAAVLKTVKDKQSAEAARRNLDEPINRFLSAMKAVKIMEPARKSRLDALALAVDILIDRYALNEEAREIMVQEADRVLKQADLQKILQKSQAWVKFETVMPLGHINRANMDVKNLEAAVMTYMTRHGTCPKTLEELTQRDPIDNSPALLSEKALRDPWDQPYIYFPNVLNSQTRKPPIYSNGSPDAPVPISNWGQHPFPANK